MVKLLASFVNWFCYLPIMNPFFDLVGEVLHIAPQTCTRYVSRAFEQNFYTALPVFLLCVALPLAILIALKVFGALNPGNLPKYDPDKLEKEKNSPLKGKRIIFLGSSVTKGFASFGSSFVDMLAARTGAVCLKEAVTGTTLVESGSKNYIARLKGLDKNQPCDLFVCQLSTNDATRHKPLGTISAGTDPASFDTGTVCGAIEYIIAYAKETWGCPVVFYTSPVYPSAAYLEMVEALRKIAQKWDIRVLDIWSDQTANEKQYKGYTCMNDRIHPTKKGYSVWLPVFEEGLAAVLAGKKLPVRATAPTVTREALKKKQTLGIVGRVIAILLAVLLLLAIFSGIAAYQHVTEMFGFKHPGNGPEYALANVTPNPDSPMQGLNILGVGSSVMAGTASKGIGPGEYLCAINNCTFIKETAVGTSVTSTERPTLDGLGTYLPRLKDHTAAENIDMVLVQLGTNDCADWVVVGEPGSTASLDLGDYDEFTFCGAMESMIAYSINTWGDDTVVAVYSNSRFEDKNVEKYQNMVEVTTTICDKWKNAGYDVYLIDMWSDEEFNNVPAELVDLYGAGEIHPRQAGYYVWWMPFWEKVLYPIFENR